jgi:hypothetical protein
LFTVPATFDVVLHQIELEAHSLNNSQWLDTRVNIWIGSGEIDHWLVDDVSI